MRDNKGHKNTINLQKKNQEGQLIIVKAIGHRIEEIKHKTGKEKILENDNEN